MGQNIEHIALVERVEGCHVIVRIQQSPDCGGCAAASLCKRGGEKEKRMVLYSEEPDQYPVGCHVRVTCADASGRRAVVLVYVLPVLLLLAALYILTPLWNEGLAALASIGILGVYFCMLHFFRGKIERKVTFIISKQ